MSTLLRGQRYRGWAGNCPVAHRRQTSRQSVRELSRSGKKNQNRLLQQPIDLGSIFGAGLYPDQRESFLSFAMR